MARLFEDWEQELLDSYRNNIRYYRDMLRNLDAGNRIIYDDLGDVTDDERQKAIWYLARYKAALTRLELGVANDNEPPVHDTLLTY